MASELQSVLHDMRTTRRTVFNQDPGNGEWSPRQILAHVADDDGYFKRMIDAAV